MKLRFHKILPEGRSVRYETKPEDKGEIIDLNIIVIREHQKKTNRD